MADNIFKTKKGIFALLAVAAVTVAIHYPIELRLLSSYDFLLHLSLAQKMLQFSTIFTPHFLYEILTIGISRLLPNGNLPAAGLYSVVLFYVLVGMILYWMLRSVNNVSRPLAGVFAVSLMLCAPVLILALADTHLYVGYIGINVFHNPSMIMLKPFALLLFYFSVRIFEQQEKSTMPVHLIVICALLVVVSAFAKPSYTICLVPALLLFFLARFAATEKSQIVVLLTGIVIPAGVVLGMQYYMGYSQDKSDFFYGEQAAIIFAPFVVMGERSSWLLPKFLASALFPLAVLSFYFRAAVKDPQLVLAWVVFLIGCFYTYFLAESGPRMFHGNFVWSGQISLFILFVASVLFLLKEEISRKPPDAVLRGRTRVLICGAVYALHLASGIIFYLAEYKLTRAYW